MITCITRVMVLRLNSCLCIPVGQWIVFCNKLTTLKAYKNSGNKVFQVACIQVDVHIQCMNESMNEFMEKKKTCSSLCMNKICPCLKPMLVNWGADIFFFLRNER